MALNTISWAIITIVVFILVVGYPTWLYVISPRYKAKEADVGDMVTFPDGTILIRTGDGVYFMAPHEDAIPLLISEEEGKRLWSQHNGN